MQLNTINAKVYYNYGLMLNENKQYAVAEKVLLKGGGISPSWPALFYVLTFVYLQSHNIIKANEAGAKQKQLDPCNCEYAQLFKYLGI